MILLTALIPGLLLAQEPDDRERPDGTLSVEATTSSKFTYQGMLRDDGVPVSAPVDMEFQLYSDASCHTLVGGAISKPAVDVEDGVFNVELAVSHSYVNGRGLWLGIMVDGENLGCQEILPVPYALSLLPGAEIEGEKTGWDVLHLVNTAETAGSYGLYARTNSSSGRGVYGYAYAATGNTSGVYTQGVIHREEPGCTPVAKMRAPISSWRETPTREPAMMVGSSLISTMTVVTSCS
jgi:hypothetical protein